MTTDKSPKKLNQATIMRVLACLARNDSYDDIVEMLLREYNIEYSKAAISYLKKHHKDTITAMRETITAHEVQKVSAESLLHKTHKMLDKQLDRAIQDDNEIQMLDEQYRNDEISEVEYRKKKRGLLSLSTAQILSASRQLFDQTKDGAASKQPHAPALPPGTPSDPALMQSLLSAIQSGNVIELQRMKWEAPKHVDANHA